MEGSNVFYNLVQVRLKADDGSPANNTFYYEDYDEAMQKFFAQLSTYWNDPTYNYLGIYLIRSDGVTIEGRHKDSRVPDAIQEG